MFSPTKLTVISKLVLDIGKIIFAAAVIGFFVPGSSGSVGISTFIVGSFLSVVLFALGVKLTQ